MYECIDWIVTSEKRDKTGKMGGRLTSQYKHSANFISDDTIVNKLNRGWGKTRHKVATGASWR